MESNALDVFTTTAERGNPMSKRKVKGIKKIGWTGYMPMEKDGKFWANWPASLRSRAKLIDDLNECVTNWRQFLKVVRVDVIKAKRKSK